MKSISRLFSHHAIRITDGKSDVIKGKLPRRQLRDLNSLCAELGLQNCEIWINKIGRVSFSNEVPTQHQQKFRNVLSAQS